MQWNWGTGVFIFIVLFLAACIAFIIYTRTERWSLVEEDYYPKELRHEEILVKMRNVSSLKDKLQVSYDAQNLVIRFPFDLKGLSLTGSVDMYRPSDETRDVILPVAVDTSLCMTIPMKRFIHGKYVLKADWVANGMGYYQETVVFIP